MQLALAGCFRARWSERIHDEWIRNLLAARPDLTAGQLARTRQLMNAHAADALVAGFEHLIDGMTLPDPDDRHVLAVAIAGGAPVIVTFNLRDFPAEFLKLHGVVAVGPDDFITGLFERNPAAVVAAVRKCRARLRAPSMVADVYLDVLRRQGLRRSVAALGPFTAAI